MSSIPTELKYMSSHEWARLEEDGSVTIGITEYAQSQLGDLVFVELPELESPVTFGQEAGVVESVKTASDIYAPISGEVIAINEALEESPELVNQDAFGAGWLFRVKPEDASVLEDLLDAEAYQEVVEQD